MRVLLFLSLLVFLASSGFSQSDSLNYQLDDYLYMRYLKGDRQKTLVLKPGNHMKVELEDGEKKSGVITDIFEDGIQMGEERVLYTEIKALKNTRYSRTVGGPLMVIGGAGVLTGGAVAGLGGLLLLSEGVLPTLIGVLFVIGGATVAIYAGVPLLVGLVVDLSAKRLNVERDKVNFLLVQRKTIH